MGDPVTVVIPGDPVAFARTRWGKQGVPITPDKQRAYQDKVGWIAIAEMAGRPPFNCPVRMDLEAQFGIPKSWSKAMKANAVIGVIRPTKKPDLDNIVKLIADSLNRIVVADDVLIVEFGTVRKVYSNAPQVIVTVQRANSVARDRAAEGSAGV